MNRTAIACLAVLGLLSAAACDPGWGTTRSHRVDNLSGQSWIVMGAEGDSVVAYSANMPAHSTISAVFPSSVTELTIELRSPSCELVATLDVSADVARIVIDSDGHISTPTSGERSSSTLQDLGSTFGTPILC